MFDQDLGLKIVVLVVAAFAIGAMWFFNKLRERHDDWFISDWHSRHRANELEEEAQRRWML